MVGQWGLRGCITLLMPAAKKGTRPPAAFAFSRSAGGVPAAALQGCNKTMNSSSTQSSAKDIAGQQISHHAEDAQSTPVTNDILHASMCGRQQARPGKDAGCSRVPAVWLHSSCAKTSYVYTSKPARQHCHLYYASDTQLAGCKLHAYIHTIAPSHGLQEHQAVRRQHKQQQ
jgi:hypothetical protein